MYQRSQRNIATCDLFLKSSVKSLPVWNKVLKAKDFWERAFIKLVSIYACSMCFILFCFMPIFTADNSHFFAFFWEHKTFWKIGLRYLLWRKAHLHFLHENHKELWLFLSSLLQTVTALPWLQNMDKLFGLEWHKSLFLKKFPVTLAFFFPLVCYCMSRCYYYCYLANLLPYWNKNLLWHQFILQY